MFLIIKKIVAGTVSLGLMTVSGYMMMLNQKIVQQNEEVREIASIVEEKPQENQTLSYREETEIQSLLGFTAGNNENAKEENLNILGVGLSGNLTDSLMVASINPKAKKITIISIPRDLAVDEYKINHAFFYWGIDGLKERIKKITGLTIHRYAMVDFDGFRAMIDAVGGIEVDVEEQISDPHYDYFIETGNHHFTGQQALRFSRSRFSTSDFDRARRQQKVLEALKVKLKKIDLVQNPEKGFAIYHALQGNFRTDISIWDGLEYYDKFKDFTIIRENVLSTENFLFSTINESGAYILAPRGNNWKEIQNHIAKLVF